MKSQLKINLNKKKLFLLFKTMQSLNMPTFTNINSTKTDKLIAFSFLVKN